MDFKSLLQTMDNISETVHKAGPGGYGNRHGSETQTDQYGKPIGKVSLASLAPKDDKPKSRGRPVDPDKPKTGKDDPKNKKVGDIFGRTTGDVPKGKKGTKVTKMADADKEEKKAEKKSLKDWIEASDANQLNEEGQITVKPMPGASQIIGGDGKPMGTADAQTANTIKAAAEKGTLNFTGDDEQMNEKSDKPVKTDSSEKGKYKGKSKSELLKAFNHLKKTGPHEKDSKQYGNMKELAVAIRAKGDSGKEQMEEGGYNPDRDAEKEWDRYAQGDRDFQNQERNAGEEPNQPRTSNRMRQAQYRHNGFPRPRSESVEEDVTEGFPRIQAARKETMQDTRDEHDRYANKDKKKKVDEARIMEESEYTYEKIGKTLSQENPTLASDSDEFANAVYNEMIQMGMTPRSAHHKLNYDEDFLGEVATAYHYYVKHNTVDEGEFTQHYMDANKPSSIRQRAELAQVPKQHTPFSVDPINATTDRVGSFLKNLGQPKKTFEGKNMKDIQLESWEKELNSLLNLNEGITVSSSTGQQGSPDSVSVNATDGDAQQLLQVLRSAGVGVFGGDQERSDYGAPMNSQEPTGAGSEPEMSPVVVGDGDDMMSLIKKMSGIQDSGEPEGIASSDYESEEGSDDDHQAQHGSDGHSHEEQGEEEVGEGYQETEEGAGTMHFKAQQAKADGENSFKLGDKEFPVEEGNDGNLANNYPPYKEVTKGDVVAGRLGQDQMGGKEKVKEEGHDHEGHETCNECGMYEARCVCEPGEEQVEEDYANEAGHEEMAQLKHLLSTGNDMHREKRSQATGDIKQVTYETKLLKDSTSLLQDFKKLSGIK